MIFLVVYLLVLAMAVVQGSLNLIVAIAFAALGLWNPVVGIVLFVISVWLIGKFNAYEEYQEHQDN